MFNITILLCFYISIFLSGVIDAKLLTRVFSILAVFLMFSMLAFNLDMSTDAEVYKYYYLESSPLGDVLEYGDKLHFEFLFGLFYSSLKSLGASYYVSQFLIASLTLYMLKLGIDRCTKFRIESWLAYYCIFFFIMHITLVRFSIVASALPMLLYLFSTQQKLKYFSFVVTLMWIHYSAVLLLPFLLIRSTISKRAIIIIILISLLIKYYGAGVTTLLENIPFDFIIIKLKNYIEMGSIYKSSLSILFIKDLYFLSLLSISLVYFKKLSDIEKTALMFVCIGMLYSSMVFAFSEILSARVFLLFSIPIIILLPKISHEIALNFKRYFLLQRCYINLLSLFIMSIWTLPIFYYYVYSRYSEKFATFDFIF
jgi:hypothetical protein